MLYNGSVMVLGTSDFFMIRKLKSGRDKDGSRTTTGIMWSGECTTVIFSEAKQLIACISADFGKR